MDFDVESREFNGKWYTDLKAWKIEVQGLVINAPIGSNKLFSTSIDKTTDDDIPPF